MRGAYKWSFDPPLFVYKVRCHFWSGDTQWVGETLVNDTLSVNRMADITVYPE